MQEAVRIGLVYGDSNTTIIMQWTYGSTVTFDPVLFTMTVQLQSQTNQVPSLPCNEVSWRIDGQITQSNNFYNLANFSYTTKLVHQYPLNSVRINLYPSVEYDKTLIVSMPFNKIIIDDFWTPAPEWWTDGSTYYFYKCYARVLITNTTDPLNNYNFYTKLNADGTVSPTWILLKQVP